MFYMEKYLVWSAGISYGGLCDILKTPIPMLTIRLKVIHVILDFTYRYCLMDTRVVPKF